MNWIWNFFRKIKTLFYTSIFRRGSIYRLENLGKRLGKGTDGNERKLKQSVKKGIKQYENRNLKAKGRKRERFFNIRNITVLCLLLLTFIFIHFSGYSVKSLYISIFIFIGITLYMLIVERFKEKVHVENEIKEIKNSREREHEVFLEKVKDMEQLEKNKIENIILKNSEGYDVKIWKIGRASSLLIGKGTPRNNVDIDLGEAVYGNLISRVHGVLNRVNGIWYYEDLGSQNGSGVERRKDGRKTKLGRNTPVKVESGDIIYLATTKLLLQ